MRKNVLGMHTAPDPFETAGAAKDPRDAVGRAGQPQVGAGGKRPCGDVGHARPAGRSRQKQTEGPYRRLLRNPKPRKSFGPRNARPAPMVRRGLQSSTDKLPGYHRPPPPLPRALGGAARFGEKGPKPIQHAAMVGGPVYP